MSRFAPRLSPRLLAYVERHAGDERVPIAEIVRRVGREAARLGLAQPSYQRVRVLVHEARRRRRSPSTVSVAVDIAFRTRAPDAMLDQISGVGVAPRDR